MREMANRAGAEVDTAGGPSPKRIRGLDTLRFCLAFWVIFAHCRVFPLTGIDNSHFLGRLIEGVYNNMVSGPAAVIVFFVISGACIHFPYRQGGELSLAPYYTRRYIRIVTPMLAAILLARPLDLDLSVFQSSILWSLVAEEVYYAIYPLLLSVKRRIGWRALIVIAYLLSLLVILRNPTAGSYPSYGPYLNWLLGLPCWLLGCYLAESLFMTKVGAPTRWCIWRWRAGIWLLSCVCHFLRFHSPVKYPWTLNLFAIVACFWLKREIAYYLENDPPAILEQFGKWSYSMYLFHKHGNALYLLLVPLSFGIFLDWVLRTIFLLAACYAFYLIVEKPSHSIAKLVARRLTHYQATKIGRPLNLPSVEAAQ